MWGAIKKAINSNLSKSLDVLIQEKATETNSKVDNRASQTSVDSINSKTGATTDTGGTASAGSIFAKLNKLLTDWTTARAGYLDTTISSRQASWGATTTHRDRIDTPISSRASQTSLDILLNGRVVKSVQYGTVTPDPSGAANIYMSSVAHSAVDLNKSIILINGGTGNGATGTAPLPYVASRTNTSFNLRCSHNNVTSFNGNTAYSWQVIEFY